jgi:DNA-binding transcriptional LysR family regulator
VEPKHHLSVDFRHLETFCRVAELRNFSKAADDLFLTQPTVSGHVISLERSLGLRLLDRTGREARLTKGGEILYQYASRMLATRREALNALSDFSEGIRGELTIGASTIPGEYLLPKLLSRFKKQNPLLAIALKIADSKEVIRYVLEGKVEFGMTGARWENPSLRYELFEQDEIVVIGPPGRQAPPSSRVRFEDLLDVPWVVREDGSGTQIAVERALNKKKKSLRQLNQTVEMGNTSSLKEAVKAGLGFGFISRRAIDEEMRHGFVSLIRIDGIEPIARQIFIVSRRGKTLSPIGTRFLRFLKTDRAHVDSPSLKDGEKL